MAHNHFAEMRLRIARVHVHLEANRNRIVPLREMAEVACFSEFHFHRVYRHWVGQTPAAVARALRLTVAANRLIDRSGTVTEIAYDTGYGSVQAFIRAFRQRFACVPSDLWRGRASFDPRAARVDPPRIVKLREIRSTGLNLRGRFGEWCRNFGDFSSPIVARGGWRPSSGLFSVLDFDAMTWNVDEHLSCQVALDGFLDSSETDAGRRIVIAGGDYAVIRQSGQDEIAGAMVHAIGKELPAMGFQVAERPWLRHDSYDPMLRPRSLHAWELFVPVDPDRARARIGYPAVAGSA